MDDDNGSDIESSKEPIGAKPREVHRTSSFKADLKRAKFHHKCDHKKLVQAMEDIANRKPLSEALDDHKLVGRYPNHRDGFTDVRECHTSNDWLLVYRYPDDNSVSFIRTGTHSDLF